MRYYLGLNLQIFNLRAWIKSVLGVLLPTFILAFVFPIAAPLQAHAADANNFNPGKIITDELFMTLVQCLQKIYSTF